MNPLYIREIERLLSVLEDCAIEYQKDKRENDFDQIEADIDVVVCATRYA